MASDIDHGFSPGAAYREAMHPVEVVRGSVGNWSTVEQASLAVAIRKASTFCLGADPDSLSGGDLVDLGRVCALGLNWGAANVSVDRYLQEGKHPSDRRDEAYAIKIDAELHLRDEANAFRAAMDMVAAIPYNSVVAASTTEAIEYMRFMFPKDALAIALKREPLILNAIKGLGTIPILDRTLPEKTPDLVSLYRQGMAPSCLEQLDGRQEVAERLRASLEGTMPAALSGDDRIDITEFRNRYELLGKPLEAPRALRSINPRVAPPKLPVAGMVTTLLLFPDWCAQCIRLAQRMPKNIFKVSDTEAQSYGLLVETLPEEPKSVPGSESGSPKSPSGESATASLQGTRTVIVDPSTVRNYGTRDVPLLIIVDAHGITRFIDFADETAFEDGDVVDSAIALLGLSSQELARTEPAN